MVIFDRGFVHLGMLLIGLGVMVGCNEDAGESDAPAEATVTSTDPPNGGTLAADGVLTINFDNPPGMVTVNGLLATVVDSMAMWTATGLTPGSVATLRVSWDNVGGTTTLTMVVGPAQGNNGPGCSEFGEACNSDGDCCDAFPCVNGECL